jgi:flavodoxin
MGKNSKTLVVYYSLEGNTKLIAETIASTTKADILEIKPVKELNKEKSSKYMWGGKQAWMHEKPELLPYDTNPNDYDVIFLGTPVWAYTFSPPIRSFIEKHKLKGKKIAVFCCYGGGMKNMLEKLKRALEGNEILGENDFIEPKTRNTEQNLTKAKQWAMDIIKKL